MTMPNAKHREKVLDQWSARLKEADEPSVVSAIEDMETFPCLEALGVGNRDIHGLNSRLEKYQAIQGILALAATVFALLCAISLFFFYPNTLIPIPPILQASLLVVATYTAFRGWVNATTYARFLRSNHESSSLIDFCERWFCLKSRYDTLIAAKQMQERILNKQQLRESAREEELRHQHDRFRAEAERQTQDREDRIRRRPPKSIRDPARYSELMAGIDEDVKKFFFSLPAEKLEEVFDNYGAEHGDGARAYAKKTYLDWKSGDVVMTVETTEKILSLVPVFPDESIQFDLIKKLREQYREKIDVTVECSSAQWQDEVSQAIERVIAASELTDLPIEVVDRIYWLVGEDALAASKLLAEIERQEALQLSRHIREEFQLIETMASGSDVKSEHTYVLELPQGTVTVKLQSIYGTALQRVVDMLT